jgi:hypothetical protein
LTVSKETAPGEFTPDFIQLNDAEDRLQGLLPAML